MLSAIPSARSARGRALVVIPLLFVTFLFSPIITRAFEADDVLAEDDSVTSRVARISYLQGGVWIRRAGANDWEDATLNLPLVEGDRLATGDDARVEIQLDRDNFIRLDRDATLDIKTLRPEGIALSLTEGTLALRLARFSLEQEFFEIDAPGATVACEQKGYYRLDAPRAGGVRLTVRETGRARLYSEQDAFTVRDGRTVERGDSEQGEWSFSSAAGFDYWDAWSGERDIVIARRINEREERFDARDVWGAEELDDYGDWSHTPDYGWVWRPRVTVINNYNDWAPYRYGRWRWCPPYGWTWVGDEPWGWAPYHYGRWVQYENTWCWTPRFYGYRPQVRSHWRPALVVFVILNRQRNSHVAWYPLDYRQPYRHHHPRHRGDGRRGDRRGGAARLGREEIARLERTNHGHLRGVTELPAREFGRRGSRGRAADRDAARQVLASEPVREGLPIVPAGVDISDLSTRPREDDVNGVRASRPDRNRMRGGMRGERGSDAARRGETARGESDGGLIVAARPSLDAPSRTVEERPTGAATRERGSPLGEMLRRARLRENRRTLRPRAEDGSANPLGGRPRDSRPRDARTSTPPTASPSTDAPSSITTSPGVTEPPVESQPAARTPRDRGERSERIERGERRGRRERDIEPGVRQGDIFARPNTGDGSGDAGRAERVGGSPERVRPERPSRREERRPPVPAESATPRLEESRPDEPRPERPREERRRDDSPRREEPRSVEPPRERPEPRSEPRPEQRSEERQERPQLQERPESKERLERPAAPPRVQRNKVSPIDPAFE